MLEASAEFFVRARQIKPIRAQITRMSHIDSNPLVPKLQFGNALVFAVTQPEGRDRAFQLCFAAASFANKRSYRARLLTDAPSRSQTPVWERTCLRNSVSPQCLRRNKGSHPRLLADAMLQFPDAQGRGQKAFGANRSFVCFI